MLTRIECHQDGGEFGGLVIGRRLQRHAIATVIKYPALSSSDTRIFEYIPIQFRVFGFNQFEKFTQMFDAELFCRVEGFRMRARCLR